MAQKHGYWIHHAIKSDTELSGYRFLPVCDCSECGYTSSLEKKICPSCGALMDRTAPKNAMVEVDENGQKVQK